MEALKTRTDVLSTDDLAAAFPASGHPDVALRLRAFEVLHHHYQCYLGDPQEILEPPELNLDPRIRAIERSWIRWEDDQVDLSRIPTSASFDGWFRDVADAHVQRGFCDYLRDEATAAQLAVFILAEELVDGRFDDLVAMVQVGVQGQAKLTIAHNYWDEMGHGQLAGMHTRMFAESATRMRRVLAEAGLSLPDLLNTEVYENACLLLLYGIHRRYTLRALGAMGVLEQSASPRFAAMVDGCLRVGMPEEVVEYQRLHIDVDAGHGEVWLDEVLVPMAARSEAHAHEIALGVLTRVRVATAYYEAVWSCMRGLGR
ncbi:MAG: iron-containing redox enzyme family protein [Acidimicrobiia bacterium]|nr:iron-containing redox enzyme family protein [Acidimicrobiia bacterium]